LFHQRGIVLCYRLDLQDCLAYLIDSSRLFLRRRGHPGNEVTDLFHICQDIAQSLAGDTRQLKSVPHSNVMLFSFRTCA